MRRRLLALLLVAAVAAVAVLIVTGQGDQAEASATIAVVNSTVTREAADGSVADLLDGDRLKPGEAVRTDAEGRAIVTFFDGSSISLEPETRLVIREMSGRAGEVYAIRLEQTDGVTWADVRTVADERSRFEIKVPDGTAVVRGTNLLTQVGKKGGASSIVVTEGRVQLVIEHLGTKEVIPGNLAVWRKDDKSFYDQDICRDPFASLKIQSFGLQMNPCFNNARNSWHLQVATDAGTLGRITDFYGRTCGEGRSQIPMCGAAGSLTYRGPQDGQYTLTLRRERGTGAVGALFALGGDICGGYFYIDCRRVDQFQSQRLAFGQVPEGALVKIAFRIAQTTSGLAYEISGAAEVVLPEPSTPKPSATAAARPVLRGTPACVADSPGKAFTGGTVFDRSRQFDAYAAANPGRAAALVVSEDDIAAAFADAAKVSPLPVSGVSARIASSRLRLTGQAAQFAVGVDVQLGATYGRLDMQYRLDGVPGWAKDQIPTAPLQQWLEGMNSGPARWERVLWRDGCLALVGTGVGTAGATAPPAPTTTTLSKRTGPGQTSIYGLRPQVGPEDTIEVAVEGCGGSRVTLERWHLIGRDPQTLNLSYAADGDPFVVRMPAAQFGPGQNFFDWKACDGHAWQTQVSIAGAPVPSPQASAAPARSFVSLGSWSGASSRDKCAMAWAVGIGEYCPFQPGPANVWRSSEVEVGDRWRIGWDLGGQPGEVTITVWNLDGSGAVRSLSGADSNGRIHARGKGSTAIDGRPGRYRLDVTGWNLAPGQSVSFTVEVADYR